MATYPSYDGNDYKSIAATDPGRFIDPSDLDRLRAWIGVQDDDRGRRPVERARSRPRPGSRTSGRSTSTRAGRRSTTPTARARAWMTFEDAVAYSRNVVAAKVALGARRLDPRIVVDPLRHVDPARVRRADRDRPGRGGRRHRPRSGPDQVARDRPGQRGVRPGRRGHPDPAGDRVCRADERRNARPAARRQGDRRQRRRRSRRAARDHRPDDLADADQDDAPRHHRGPVLPRPHARPRLRRRRQDRDRPDLGLERGRRARAPGSATCSTTRSSATSAARRASPTSSSRSGSRRARRPSRASATSRCRSCRSSSSGGSRPTRSRRPTCWPTGR